MKLRVVLLKLYVISAELTHIYQRLQCLWLFYFNLAIVGNLAFSICLVFEPLRFFELAFYSDFALKHIYTDWR